MMATAYERAVEEGILGPEQLIELLPVDDEREIS